MRALLQVADEQVRAALITELTYLPQQGTEPGPRAAWPGACAGGRGGDRLGRRAVLRRVLQPPGLLRALRLTVSTAAPTGVTAKVTDECTSRWPPSAGPVQTAGNLACPAREFGS